MCGLIRERPLAERTRTGQSSASPASPVLREPDFGHPVCYARTFNTLGGENMADPIFADGPADLFFSAPEADRATVETVITGVGLHPIYLGADQEALVDALFQVWITLALKQGRGRRLALRLLDH
jgi:hypothetical protein